MNTQSTMQMDQDNEDIGSDAETDTGHLQDEPTDAWWKKSSESKPVRLDDVVDKVTDTAEAAKKHIVVAGKKSAEGTKKAAKTAKEASRKAAQSDTAKKVAGAIALIAVGLLKRNRQNEEPEKSETSEDAEPENKPKPPTNGQQSKPRPKPPVADKPGWQTLSRQKVKPVLAEAQSRGSKVYCAGCGRLREYREMQLDHIHPKRDGGEDIITNFVLLCGPCNRSKGSSLSLSGLQRRNKANKYMHNEENARTAMTKASEAAQFVRDHWHLGESQTKLAKASAKWNPSL